MNVPKRVWRARSRQIVLDRPFIVGILNVTPDSFSDGGQFVTPQSALAQAERMVSEGADAIDVGGQSTRPQGATVIPDDEQIRRTVPVISAIRRFLPDVPISVDTTTSGVASAALDAGADIVNDVSAFRLDPRMGEIVAASGAGVILMHSRGGVSEMGTYQFAEYRDVVTEVTDELRAAVAGARAAGIASDAIVLDPGVGFAKRSEHSLRVLASLDRLASLGYPVLVGVSRKRVIGELSGVTNAAERVPGTVGANVAALMRGARLFRVHDVAPNRQALAVAWAVLRAASVDERPPRKNHDAAPSSQFPPPGSP